MEDFDDVREDQGLTAPHIFFKDKVRDYSIKPLVAGIRLTEKSYLSNTRLPNHEHEQPYFCFVLEGEYTENYEKRTRSCRSSNLIFHPAGEKHSDYFCTGTRCFDIQIDNKWLARFDTQLISGPECFYGGQLANLSRRLYREFCESDEFSYICVEGLVTELIAEAFRDAKRTIAPSPPLWLRRVRDLIHEQFGNCPSLLLLAQSASVHPVHLSREFHRFYHCTISEYVLRRRVESTCGQLVGSNASLTDIALGAGFFDQSHFTKTFKKLVGLTPGQYRQTFVKTR